jgi:predicted nucleic acid-binding protein
VFYLDASAAAKLVLAEDDSDAMKEWIETTDAVIVSSDLLRTELLRTIRRHAPAQLSQGRAVLESITLIAVSRNVYERAAMLGPPVLRSLDALHLASAADVGGDELTAIITYDLRMIEAARSLGIETIAPV